jgi:alkyl hydroperoxide reductase subunit AhpF
MAIASPHITAQCIDAAEFPELSQRYQVMAVPKIVINDAVEFEGALPERDFLAAVLRAAAGPAAQAEPAPAPAAPAEPAPAAEEDA